MCDFCNGKKTMKSDDMRLKVDGTMLEVEYAPLYTGDHGTTERFQVNYCPHCGAKLNTNQ